MPDTGCGGCHFFDRARPNFMFFFLRAPFGQYGPVAALYWALVCVPRPTRALDQGGVEPRLAVGVRPEGHRQYRYTTAPARRAPTLWQSPPDVFPIPERCALCLPNSWALISTTPLPRCWVAKTLVCEQIQRFWLRKSKQQMQSEKEKATGWELGNKKAQGSRTFLALLSNGNRKQKPHSV